MPIHPTAIVDPAADISPEAEIGPYCIIGSGVNIGAGTRLLAHVYMEGKLTVGEQNVFYPYSSIGVTPQDKKYRGEPSETRIGNFNSIREFVTINRGTEGGGMLTSIGHANLLMAYVHVAHDVIIHNHTIIGNGVTFAGHIVVEDFANISGLTAVHHYVRIGRNAMVGSRSVIKQDVLPYSITAATHQVEVFGANRVGLERSGYSNEAIEALQSALRLLTRSGLNTTQALARIEEEVPQSEEVKNLLSFIRESTRGFIK